MFSFFKSGYEPLPKKYEFLNCAVLPKHMRIALSYYGLKEIPGKVHAKEILDMALYLGRKAGIKIVDDETPWCGTFVGYCLKKSGWNIPDISVRAKSFLNFGEKVNHPALSDVLVFDRNGGGHVGFYIAESKDTYYVLGGNQSNMVNIIEIEKSRLVGARRPAYDVLPTDRQKIVISSTGEISYNEA